MLHIDRAKQNLLLCLFDCCWARDTKNALTLLETPTIKIAVILNGRRFSYCSCVVLIMRIIHSQSATLQRRCAETARSVIVNRYIGVNKRSHVYLSSEIHWLWIGASQRACTPRWRLCDVCACACVREDDGSLLSRISIA